MLITNKDLSIQLRRWRYERMVTQRELADASGVSLYTITRIEARGGRSVQATTLRRLADGLGIKPIQLLAKATPRMRQRFCHNRQAISLTMQD